jgi:hypothetical protein
MEVDEYLLAPFSVPELCRRVDRCLHPTKIPQPESVFEGRGGMLNGRILNSLRLKFFDMDNTLFSPKAHMNMVSREKYGIRKKGNLRNLMKYQTTS